MQGLSGKVAIITGAARGLGRAVALALARESVRVVLWDIDADGIGQLTNEILKGGGESQSIVVDVTKLYAINQAIAKIMRQYQRVDLLVNNAGITADVKFTEIGEDQWHRMLDVNLTSMFLCCKAVVPIMIQRGTGKIVNISSQAAMDGSSEAAHYSASKAGVIGLTRSLARELGPSGIMVNAVAPGIIRTDMNPPSRIEQKGPGWLDRLPLRRFGDPQDVAEVILFLLSDAASYITGQTILVNGGMRMGA